MGAVGGKLTDLLRLLAEHESAVEADLQRYYGVDYRDRWRGDLSLRRISNLLRHLPPDSALAHIELAGTPAWNLEHVLLADIWQAVARSKKQHPMLVKARQQSERFHRPDPQRMAELASARREAEARRRAIEAGEIT